MENCNFLCLKINNFRHTRINLLQAQTNRNLKAWLRNWKFWWTNGKQAGLMVAEKIL
jgi:hypothetical protein